MRNVVGMFETRLEAENAIVRLNASGVRSDAISLAMKDPEVANELFETTGAHDLSGEGAATGAVSGAAVGTLIGLALLGSTIILPGVGTFLIGGPLAAAGIGAGIGAASGGLLGAMIGAGIPEPEAGQYASRLEEGHILVAASVPEAEAAKTLGILEEEGARLTRTI